MKTAQKYWDDSKGTPRALAERIKTLKEKDIPDAEKKVMETKDEAKKLAQQDLNNKKAKLKQLEGFASKPADAAKSLYWSDAYSLVATPGRSACLNCHRVGDVPANEEKGPPLELSFSRLRPGWTEHWVAYPNRLITYNNAPMPQNFPRNKPEFQELFPG